MQRVNIDSPAERDVCLHSAAGTCVQGMSVSHMEQAYTGEISCTCKSVRLIGLLRWFSHRTMPSWLQVQWMTQSDCGA
jgi:hypothetical protein